MTQPTMHYQRIRIQEIHRTRLFWVCLLGTAVALEAAALGFQYLMDLRPCVLCIYERVAVAGIGLAGIVGALAPHRPLPRFAAYLIWAGAAAWGLSLASEHVGIQFATSNLSCEFFANFPPWFQLDQWLPSVFAPTGYCDEIQWQFLGLTMPQWMLVVYSGYLLLLAIVLVNEFRLRVSAGLAG